MANTKIEQLIQTAAMLSNVAPKEWEEFLQAIEAYSIEANRRLLAAEPALLANAQGQAIQIDYILTTLTNARKTMQKVDLKRKPPNERVL